MVFVSSLNHSFFMTSLDNSEIHQLLGFQVVYQLSNKAPQEADSKSSFATNRELRRLDTHSNMSDTHSNDNKEYVGQTLK